MCALQTGVAWLHKWCIRIVGPEDALDIATSISLVLLKEQGSGDATANDLVEMLGFAAFDAIGELMDNRSVSCSHRDRNRDRDKASMLVFDSVDKISEDYQSC